MCACSVFRIPNCLAILRLFVLGNGMHVPMVTSWLHYVLNRCVRRSYFFALGPTLCGAAGAEGAEDEGRLNTVNTADTAFCRDDVFEDL